MGWATVRKAAGHGFRLLVTLETGYHSEFNFVSFASVVDRAEGEFLGFLQTSMSHRLKDGSVPAWTMSRVLAPLYGLGINVKRVRVFLGWTSIVCELLFAVIFFTQLEKIFMSREMRLMSAVTAIYDTFSSLYRDWANAILEEVVRDPLMASFALMRRGGPHVVFSMIVDLVRSSDHVLVLFALLPQVIQVIITMQSLSSTVRRTIRSLLTVRTAAEKAHKSLTKARGSQKVAPTEAK